MIKFYSEYPHNFFLKNIYFINLSSKRKVNLLRKPLFCTQTSAVKVGDILFLNIKGTSATHDAVKFACSDSFPCEKIILEDIELSLYSGGDAAASCWKASGYSYGAMLPPSCLDSDDLLIKQNALSTIPLYSSS